MAVSESVEEIIIEKRNRSILIGLCILGLIIFGGFLALLICVFIHSYQSVPPVEGLFLFFFNLSLVLFILWSFYTLNRDRNYLKTEPEGIVFGGRVRCYCTWDNVKDIYLQPREIRHKNGQAEILYLVAIEFHSTKDLYFDNILDRVMSLKAISDDRLTLFLRSVTSLSPDQVCTSLRERWKLTSPTSTSVPGIDTKVEDSIDILPKEITVHRREGGLNLLILFYIAPLIVLIYSALTRRTGINWGLLLISIIAISPLIWEFFLIFSGKPLLETTPEGLMLNGVNGRCYVPWKNIKEIYFESRKNQRYITSFPKYPDRRIKFEFHDSQDIYYDNPIYRMAGKFRGPGYILNPIGGEANISIDLVEALKARQQEAERQ